MCSNLKTVDLLAFGWVCVREFDCYRDIVKKPDDQPDIFIVIDDDEKLLGIIGKSQAAHFPASAFAELVVRDKLLSVLHDTPLNEMMECVNRTYMEYIPVIERDSGALIGVINQLSIFNGLIKAEIKLNKQLSSDYKERSIAEAVFSATSEGIMVTDAEKRIIKINRAFTETTGYTETDVLGESPKILSSGKHNKEFYSFMHDQLEKSGAWEGEVWNRRKNGEVYPEWLHINAIKDDKGNIAHYAGVFSDISKNKEMRERLRFLAYHDALTNLPNRVQFIDRLKQEIAKTRRGGEGFSLLFIDLDGFKEINDNLGHGHGDDVLVRVSERLCECIRESDTIARLGGDEFTIILDRANDEMTAIASAKKILNSISMPIKAGNQSHFFTASIGISRFPGDGDNTEELVRAADTAMYQAKESGKGCFRFYSVEMHERASKRMSLANELRHSLDCGKLSIAWQPQMCLKTKKVRGFEALVRWRRADGTDITPSEFVPLAEQTGLMEPLGNWVIHKALHEARSIQTAIEGHDVRFSINLSPLQITSDTYGYIIKTLSDSGLCPEHFEVELTETSLSTARDSVIELLHRLGDKGVQVAVDDFGTGFSNIATMKLLPVRKLKIDKSFVDALDGGSADREIVRAVVDMSHALDFEVVAEGIETQAQEKFLTDIGCDQGQGYLFSRPMYAGDMQNWLSECI
ncbi:EAL domain-containing protein [Thiohalophilus sp.]|uniref:EAL domain-containing protein n=1 Tax=Thiohalophilus sp. TaxID=3028392 RepID=UPI002ACEAD48|nr:EAL domain-containing protein [Thiohalophilus sp.]MDZ7804131.1 EAL domain-containing protein [Thiohalophilus sp.]